jgi:sulfur-carrier protein
VQARCRSRSTGYRPRFPDRHRNRGRAACARFNRSRLAASLPGSAFRATLAMMRIRVLYFAGVKELLGRGEESLELPGAESDVARVQAQLIAAHPQLEARLDAVRFAVNEDFAVAGTVVRDGDVLAIIPPVSGG